MENSPASRTVVTMSADPAIYGAQMGILANPNLVSRVCRGGRELEKKVVRQMALLAGYDPARATGIFTQGDVCNLYGYLLGIRKSLATGQKQGARPLSGLPKKHRKAPSFMAGI